MRSCRASTLIASLYLTGLSAADSTGALTSCASDAYTTEKQSPNYFNRSRDHGLKCLPQLDALTTITPELYFVNLPCLDCPVRLIGPQWETLEAAANSTLLYNVSLSADATHLLLNEKPLFPTLVAMPSPDQWVIPASQLSSGFAREDLDRVVGCTKGPVPDNSTPLYHHEWCITPKYHLLGLDFDYSAYELSRSDHVVQWEVNFDAIGGHDGQAQALIAFKHASQKMMRITVTGTAVEQEEPEPDVQAASTLFGPFGETHETKYVLHIDRIELVDRHHTFPPPPPQTPWNKFLRFFNFDRADPKGHIIYHQDEWDQYGRKGTLKNAFGHIVHEWPWREIFVTVGGIFGTLLVLYGVYRLYPVVVEQRRLAQWGGMDEVWRQIREFGSEEDGLLEPRYRDDPDDPPSYTDEVHVNKPLPSKPLPEKPLPAVPLIDNL